MKFKELYENHKEINEQTVDTESLRAYVESLDQTLSQWIKTELNIKTTPKFKFVRSYGEVVSFEAPIPADKSMHGSLVKGYRIDMTVNYDPKDHNSLFVKFELYWEYKGSGSNGHDICVIHFNTNKGKIKKIR